MQSNVLKKLLKQKHLQQLRWNYLDVICHAWVKLWEQENTGRQTVHTGNTNVCFTEVR